MAMHAVAASLESWPGTCDTFEAMNIGRDCGSVKAKV